MSAKNARAMDEWRSKNGSYTHLLNNRVKPCGLALLRNGLFALNFLSQSPAFFSFSCSGYYRAPDFRRTGGTERIASRNKSKGEIQ